MSVLVTGSRGFIGSALTRFLSSRGFQVREFDLELNQRMDITSPEDVRKGLESKPEVVVHLAGNANPRYSIENPVGDLRSNTIGTIVLLSEASRIKPVPYFIFASSAYVYGKTAPPPITEEHPTKPTTPYGIGKAAAERYVDFYSQRYGVPYTILRLFNIFGPGQRAGYVVPDLINKIKKARETENRRLDMLGHPEDGRDFLYIGDFVEALGRVVERKPQNQLINVGGGRPVKIAEVAHMIARLLDIDAELAYSNPPDTANLFYASVTRAEQILSWAPQTSLEAGLRKVAFPSLREKD